MSVKEKAEKENEQFSSSILYLATVVYVGVCAMVFGALYEKLPSFGDAFLVLMKDYGTILAGIPVLVAVVVAKQQLDANRRQHVATVKRSFKEPLDVLSAANLWVSCLLAMSFDQQLENQHPDAAGFQIWPLNSTQIERGKSHLAPNFIFSFESLNQKIDEFQRRYMWGNECELRERYEVIQNHAFSLRERLNKEQNELSQYWS